MFPIIRYPQIKHQDKRHIHDGKEAMVVKFNALKKQFTMNLKRNKIVLSPSFHVESLDEKGQAIHKNKLNNCYYHGKLDKIDQSTVALSTCNGLVSVV